MPSLDNLKLKIARAEFTKALTNKHVFTSVANNSFSGEINQKNDKVVMHQLGDITINSYAGTSITSQELTTSQKEIIADQDKYFSYTLDTLDFANDKGKLLTEAMRMAAYAANDDIDTDFAGLYAQAGIVQNTNASPVDMTSLNVEDEFLEMAETFADSGIARGVRKFAIVPAWVITKLTLAGIAAKTDNDGLYNQGYFTHALGWDIVESPNISKNSSAWDKSRLMFGVYGESFGYAAAVSTIETTQVEDLIGVTKVKGRYIFGRKIVRPDKTGVLYADKSPEA